MMRLYLPLLFILTTVVRGAPTCHDLVLDWGTYKPSLNANGICVYSNVRFASPPVGQLRFAKPQYPPAKVNGVAPPAPVQNPICIQMGLESCAANGPIPNTNKTCIQPFGDETEDCLFLDIYVPPTAFSMEKLLPVVIWIYGGGYTSGSKTQFDPTQLPFYTGDGVVNTATEFNRKDQESVIFVTGNYRLGAFGWLAGQYMESNGGQPNAGLLDQRAVMQFVQDNIVKVKGDANQVSVWGESAGASSIMHHLAMPVNINQTLFRKAILQSPAYQWMWQQNTTLNDTFNTFAGYVAKAAQCSVADMACLRGASSSAVAQANGNFSQVLACTGILPFGPSVDGGLVPDLAPVQFYKGAVATIDSIIVSHVDLEVPYPAVNSTRFSFIPSPIRADRQNETTVVNFLEAVFPGAQYSSIRAQILAQYPSKAYSDQVARAQDIITACSFTCNTRFIIDRYLDRKIPVYALDYAVFRTYAGQTINASTHGTDLLPLFANQQTLYNTTLKCIAPDWVPNRVINDVDQVIRNDVAPVMQKFFTNHAIYTNVNNRHPALWTWHPASVGSCPNPSDGRCVQKLMVPSIPLDPQIGVWSNNTGPDLLTSDRICTFWNKIAQQVSAISNGKTVKKPHNVGALDVDEDQAAMKYEL